jgi:hypothetical protein
VNLPKVGRVFSILGVCLFAGVVQGLECLLAKQEVDGSNPFARSNSFRDVSAGFHDMRACEAAS